VTALAEIELSKVCEREVVTREADVEMIRSNHTTVEQVLKDFAKREGVTTLSKKYNSSWR
jgi:hypothetical protein